LPKVVDLTIEEVQSLLRELPEHLRALAIPLDDLALSVLTAQRGRHPRWVFVYRDRPTAKCTNSAWVKARRRAGLPDIRWHDIRHLWATWHTLIGTPQRVLQALGGWKDERMVARYATLNVDMTAPWTGNAFGARHTFGTDPEGGKEAPENNSNADNALAGVADGIRTHNNRNHNPGLYR
jgi:Phage integrase family